MVAGAQDEFICDMAQYYRIYDWRQFPPRYIAVLANGLPDDSRAKMKLKGQKVPTQTLILALIADYLAVNNWFQTEDGQKGINQPKSLVEMLRSEPEEEPKVRAFNTPQEFENRLKQLKGG